MYETGAGGRPHTLGKSSPGDTGLDGAALRSLFGTINAEELIGFRRELHRRPELGYKEFGTTRRICAWLEAVGLEPRILPGGTGLICDIGPKTDAPVIALRADIDALPLQDEKLVPYRSEVDGVTHACGHDVHMATVLGVGLLMNRLAKSGKLPGRVRLIFEPAEECYPCGAPDVIAAGVLNGVDRIYAVHCWPHLPVGQFGIRRGTIASASDVVRIKVTGPGGHSSRPQNTIDVVYTLCSIVAGLAGALSRRVDPRSAFSVVFGHITAGSAPNVISSEGFVEGTVRCQDNQARDRAPELIKHMAEAVADQLGAKDHVEVTYVHGNPASVNEAGSVQLFRDAATLVLGETAVVPIEAGLGADSFGHYQLTVPGAYIQMGSGLSAHDLHHPRFDVDEDCILAGVKALSATVLKAQGTALV